MEAESENGKYLVTLIYSIFVAGLCSIVYELQIATTSSYFEGDSVKQFSMVIGVYMAAMGFGSYLSKSMMKGLIQKFIIFEILLALVGGLSVPIIYLAFALTEWTQFVTLSLTALIGALIGLEIPLLTRLMGQYQELRVNIANVLTLDYVGALIATMAFPFLLLPYVGSYKTSIVLGLVNMSIGYINIWCFREELGHRTLRTCVTSAVIGTTVLLVTFFASDSFLKNWNNAVFDDRVVYAEQTSYQNIVLTRDRKDLRLYINGNLQFSSLDEYRYHESLVHIPMMSLTGPTRALVFGAGDGMAIRELLKYPNITSITLVDLDKRMVEIAKTNPYISKINQSSLEDPRVQVFHKDAFRFLFDSQSSFDLVVSDLPDPNNNDLARLYSQEFYKLVHSHLKPSGIFVAQSTSPLYARKAFWCIFETLKSVDRFIDIRPYHTHIPSFGDWGFVIARRDKDIQFRPLQVKTRFIETSGAQNLFYFGKDMGPVSVTANSLDRPTLLGYYLEGWKYWN